MKNKTLWKSLKLNLNSHGNFTWEVGKWYKCKGKPMACENGFHASVRAIDAMRYVNCEHLALVEVKGKSDTHENDKECWSEMRLVTVYDWKKADSVALAIYAAELVIDIYEKEYPKDKRPREAIEAAKKWLDEPTEKNMNAAAANAANAANANAAYAAAANANAAAANAAYAAAANANAAAANAANAAAANANANAAKKILDKCETWIQKRIKTLKEYKNV